ncbi:MAG: diguanylate cyclase [Gammaproteobacteria bacterium]
MSKHRLSSEETLPLMLSAAGAIGVLPLAIVRLRAGDWIIGIFDLVIVSCMAALGLYVWRTHRVRMASILLAVLCAIGVVITVTLKGPVQIFWAYPSVLAIFFLMLPREAAITCALMTVGLVPALLGRVESITVSSVLITLLLTNAFAYAFAVLTSDQRDQLLQLATRDPLTGADNRRALEERMADGIAAHQRSQKPLSLLLFDIDHFKRINDSHGHDVGDEVLINITKLVAQRIRATDKLFRIGGEEFVILVDGDIPGVAAPLAEDLRKLVETSDMPASCRVTMSIGVAQLTAGETPRGWLRRADEALYVAKNGGRNQVSIAA